MQDDNFTFFDRPQRAPSLYPLEELTQQATAIRKSLLASSSNPFSLFVLPFAAEVENAADLLITLVRSELLCAGQRVGVISPSRSTNLPDPAEHDCLIIHHAPQVGTITAIIEQLHTIPIPALLTGYPHELQLLGLETEADYLSPLDRTGGNDRLDAQLDKLRSYIHNPADNSGVEMVYRVCAAESFAVCLSCELLAASVNSDCQEAGLQIEAAGRQGVLFWMDRPDSPVLQVSCGSVRLARHLLTQFRPDPEKLHQQYAEILSAVEPTEMTERHEAMQLIRNLLSQSALRHELLDKYGKIVQLRQLVSSLSWLMDSSRAAELFSDHWEALSWTVLLRDLAMFPLAEALVNQCRNRWDDLWLAHSHAHLLALWAQIEPDRADDGERAFNELYTRDQNNLYILLSWANLLRSRANTQQAKKLLDRGLGIARGHLALLATRADLALDAGKWESAERDIQQGLSLQPGNIRMLHLAARLKLYKGDLEQATENLRKIEALDHQNLYALVTETELALLAGDPDKAENLVRHGLVLDPENATLLHTLAKIRILEADQLRGRTNQQALQKLEEADRLLNSIKIIEGGMSSQLLVGLANVSLLPMEWQLRKADQQQIELAGRFVELLAQHQPDQARLLHLQGRLAEAQGLFSIARSHYSAILETEKQNCYALFSLALLAKKQSQQERMHTLIDRLKEILDGQSARIPYPEKQALLHKLGTIQSA
jgi:predicted Zn-dependent protease